jgi:hypothetical protein
MWASKFLAAGYKVGKVTQAETAMGWVYSSITRIAYGSDQAGKKSVKRTPRARARALGRKQLRPRPKTKLSDESWNECLPTGLSLMAPTYPLTKQITVFPLKSTARTRMDYRHLGSVLRIPRPERSTYLISKTTSSVHASRRSSGRSDPKSSLLRRCVLQHGHDTSSRVGKHVTDL